MKTASEWEAPKRNRRCLLDTNFILSCISQKIDFMHDLITMGYEIIIPEEVIQEIDGLSISKGRGMKVKNSASLALSIINLNQNHTKIISLSEGGRNKVDNLIVRYAKTHPETAIATLDNELKRKLKNNMKIIIMDKRKLEASSK